MIAVAKNFNSGRPKLNLLNLELNFILVVELCNLQNRQEKTSRAHRVL